MIRKTLVSSASNGLKLSKKNLSKQSRLLHDISITRTGRPVIRVQGGRYGDPPSLDRQC